LVTGGRPGRLPLPPPRPVSGCQCTPDIVGLPRPTSPCASPFSSSRLPSLQPYIWIYDCVGRLILATSSTGWRPSRVGAFRLPRGSPTGDGRARLLGDAVLHLVSQWRGGSALAPFVPDVVVASWHRPQLLGGGRGPLPPICGRSSPSRRRSWPLLHAKLVASSSPLVAS
jgi:hypothetical protein